MIMMIVMIAHHKGDPDSLPVLLGWYDCHQLLGNTIVNMVTMNTMMVMMKT